MEKWICLFDEGRGDMKALLGGKGAGLAEMSDAGLPVPPGFTITTAACQSYYQNDKLFPEGISSSLSKRANSISSAASHRRAGRRVDRAGRGLAGSAEFFSFGTNDLTQTTLGLSRDDSDRFLPGYVAHGLLTDDPFQTLDETGVGQLVQMGTERGRSVRPDLKAGICGEHGGDPRSIAFCDDVGLVTSVARLFAFRWPA